MHIKVKLHEFTYKDKNGYRTIVGEGDVPENNSTVQAALKSRVLIPFPESKPKPESAGTEVSAGRKEKKEKEK